VAQLSTTADHDRFDEAAQYFLTRVVLTEREALALGTDAGRRAFWVGGGLQLTQIQRVFDSIGKAQDSGEPFEAWRERVRGELVNDAHAETVFRNAVQRSYSAGRYAQMREPSVAKFRPYVMFDAVVDTKTTTICRRCHGTILPLEHEFWATHTPPLHHRCRAGHRSLRREEAERRGITNVPPALDPPDGFGHAPDHDPVWKPDADKHDPALLRELKRKEGKAPKEPPPKPAPKEHNPAHWEKHYEKKFGEAAPAIAWGRAMQERGIDRSPADVLEQLQKLRKAGVPGPIDELITATHLLEENRPLRRQILSARQRYAATLAEHARTIEVGDIPTLPGIGGSGPKQALKFYGALADKSVRFGSDWTGKLKRGARAYASPLRRLIVLGNPDNAGTAVHEMAHAIEFSRPLALARSLAFLQARTKGESLQQLSELTGIPYGAEERARPDLFINPYMGKDYGRIATEITSMGYELMAGGGGAGVTLTSLLDDSDMLLFLLGQLAGR
jgi:SPP1 gp7 family putative phage head morphogenesis protein